MKSKSKNLTKYVQIFHNKDYESCKAAKTKGRLKERNKSKERVKDRRMNHNTFIIRAAACKNNRAYLAIWQ